tara:strand:+ start:3263 stop:4708 length:1446 start_codon:yes stop_codon:yes gene_type:complete
MSLGINSLLSDIDNKMEVFRTNPEQAKQRAKMTGSMLDAIAAEKVLNDKIVAANELKRQLPGELPTIVDQTNQELQGRAVQELAEGIGKIFQVNQARKQKNLNKIASMGLGGAKRPNMAVPMAQGGIIGYQAGNTVFKNDPYGTARGRRLQEIMQMDISPEAKRKLLEEEQVMTSGPGIPVRQIAPATVNRPELTPTISPGTELSGLDVLAEDLLAKNQMSAAMKPKSDQTVVEQAVSEQPVTGADMFKTTPILDVTEQEQEKEEVVETKEEVSPETPPAADDTPEERTKKVNAYERWFDNLLTVLSAPPTGRGLGGGNVARALLQNKQKIFENDLAADKLDIEEKKADALVELNKLEAEKLSFNKLMALQTSVLEAIQKIRADVDGGMLGIQREGIRTKLLKAQQENDPEKIAELQEQLRDIDVMMKSAVRKAAQAYQGPLGSNGLFAQLAAIEQLLGLRGSQGGIPSGFQNKLNVVTGP